jgi:hypothetical protein
VLVELLFSPIGLLILTPVMIAGAIGLILVYRRGHRLEAGVAAAVAVLYLLWNAGYETPFGGNSPGPRFLVVTLPFLALGFAAAYRAFPLTALALAICSGVEMVVLTLTTPLLTDDRAWFHRFATGQFAETILDLLKIGHGVALFFVALAAALAFGLLATTKPVFRVVDVIRALLAAAGWIVLVRRAPDVLDDHGPWTALGLAGAVLACVVLVPSALVRVRGLAGLRPTPRRS